MVDQWFVFGLNHGYTKARKNVGLGDQSGAAPRLRFFPRRGVGVGSRPARKDVPSRPRGLAATASLLRLIRKFFASFPAGRGPPRAAAPRSHTD